MDPNVQKEFKKFQKFSGGYPRFSEPAKTAYQSRKSIKHRAVKSKAHVRWFWCAQAAFSTLIHLRDLFLRENMPIGTDNSRKSSAFLAFSICHAHRQQARSLHCFCAWCAACFLFLSFCVAVVAVTVLFHTSPNRHVNLGKPIQKVTVCSSKK